MKPALHPEMHAVKVHCACGNEFETLSTMKEVRLEICGACHPHYTGKRRSFQAKGRVQQFESKYEGIDVKESAKASRAKGAQSSKVAAKKATKARATKVKTDKSKAAASKLAAEKAASRPSSRGPAKRGS